MIDDLMIKKIEAFKEKQIPIHLGKKDGEWLNGFIDEISTEFLILDEFKKGKIPIFFVEILFIETFTKKEGENDEP
jgi:hypothetical protein